MQLLLNFLNYCYEKDIAIDFHYDNVRAPEGWLIMVAKKNGNEWARGATLAEAIERLQPVMNYSLVGISYKETVVFEKLAKELRDYDLFFGFSQLTRKSFHRYSLDALICKQPSGSLFPYAFSMGKDLDEVIKTLRSNTINKLADESGLC